MERMRRTLQYQHHCGYVAPLVDMQPTSSHIQVHILHHREIRQATAALSTIPWPKCSQGDGVRREGGLDWRRGGASCDYSSRNWSGRRSEVQGGAEVKNREGQVTRDSDLNPRDPAGKHYTDPCVYTEIQRFTACINMPHTVLFTMVSLSNSCTCMSTHRYANTHNTREKSKIGEREQTQRRRVRTMWDRSAVNHINSSLWKFP